MPPSDDANATGGLIGLLQAFYADHAHALTNGLVLVVLALAAWLVWRASRRAYWRDAARRVFQDRKAAVCFVILCLYGLVGLLESIGWRDALRDESGGVVLAEDGSRVLEARGRTLLDRLDAVLLNLGGKTEKTFSAPLATHSFAKETIRDDDGTATRDYVPLQHPRAHPFGTDRVGDDVLLKALRGIRTALVIGGFTTILVIPFALLFGIAAGYYGKRVDDAVTYVYSTLASIPDVLVIAAFILIFGRGVLQLCIIMGVTTWTGLCRVLRGETLKLREMEFVQAAQAFGVSGWKIMTRHILSNVLHIVLISSVLRFSGLVLAEAVLSYLNIGVGATTASWGSMINDARFELSRDPVVWWNLVAAFAFMFGLVLPANIFGDAVRDALDPRLRAG
ncbi:ABC transporter permease [Candidatus Poribacteria bacterium]|nr:ABC transporter permease [Candidatus Poribacteria bacterium]